MAKHRGITLRIGAAYDEVQISGEEGTMTFDRAEMRKNGHRKEVHDLRRAVVSAFEEERKPRKIKDRRRQYNAARKAKRQVT